MRRMSTWISSGRLHRRPGLIDPGIRRGRLTLRPPRGRGDVPDGDGDDPRRIEDGERVLRHLRSEEHTSELQSRGHLVCRLLLEKKKKDNKKKCLHSNQDYERGVH